MARPSKTLVSALLPRALAAGAMLVSACAAPPAPALPFGDQARPTRGFSEIPYATWSEAEPAYRLYPGDLIDVSAPSAPELARSLTVQPDGRISLPLVGSVMAADRSVPELEAILAAAYSRDLRDPRIEVSVKQASPLKIFVGGEVRNPGVYDMPGDIDALQGVLLAGGFLPTARRGEVVLIRRSPDGRPMMRTLDLKRAVFNPSGGAPTPLRRFDIVYVPKSAIGEIDQFVNLYLVQTLPVQFSYAVGKNYVSAP